MVAFRAAFDQKERNRLIKQVTNAEPARLAKLNRQVPQDLETIVHISRRSSTRRSTRTPSSATGRQRRSPRTCSDLSTMNRSRRGGGGHQSRRRARARASPCV